MRTTSSFLRGSDRSFWLLCAGLIATLVWGVVSGDVRALFGRMDAGQAGVARQRALDRVFGSDRAFDPAAENVVKEAASEADTISWKMLGEAHMRMRNGVPEAVEFGARVRALDGKEVVLSGYMFPLEASGGQGHFLLSAYPPGCPYCLPGDASQLVEIRDSEAVAFTDERITIRGIFRLLKGEDLNEGMFYRMTQITMVSAYE